MAGARGRTEEGDACVSGAFNTNRNLINANNAESGRNRVNKAIEGDGRRFFNKVLVSDSLSSFGLFVLQHIVVCVESREKREMRRAESLVLSVRPIETREQEAKATQEEGEEEEEEKHQ